MKQFTKKFINRKPTNDNNIKNKAHNAKKANEKLGIPEKLYLELSKEFPKNNLHRACYKINDISTAFIAGFIVGWAEKNKKIL